MSITLKPLDELRINGKSFVVQSDPDPDMSHRPYIELGGSGQVVQLSLANTQEFHALKVFNNPDKSLIISTRKLEKNNIQNLPGLVAAKRVVINPKEEEHTVLLNRYPYLEYSVLMPWIGGYTWFEILGGKDDKKIFKFSKKTSLYYGWQLAYVLAALEKIGCAHCDICSNNIILDFKNPSVQLIDIEDMYMPGGNKKEDFIGGQHGYAHPNRPLGHQWVKESDRFGGGLLISEILTWYDPVIRESSESESFYSNHELCRITKKYKLMKGVLEQLGGLELARLFERVWISDSLEGCPTLGEWESQLHSIVQNADVKSPEVGDLSGLGADGRIRIQRKKVSLNDKGEENKGNIKSNRKKVEVTSYPSNYSQQTVQPARSFQAQTDWGKVIGFILVAALIIFICIALFSAIAGAIFVENTPLPSSTSTSSYVVPATVIVTKTFRSTSTQLQPIRLTKTPKPSDLAGYSCPDKSKIKLRVGEKAIVPYYDVNLREQPIVPEVWDANIVVMLRKGDTMLVIGGPKCAHEGTWWEVKTDNGYTGWVRELQPNKILIEPLD